MKIRVGFCGCSLASGQYGMVKSEEGKLRDLKDRLLRQAVSGVDSHERDQQGDDRPM